MLAKLLSACNAILRGNDHSLYTELASGAGESLWLLKQFLQAMDLAALWMMYPAQERRQRETALLKLGHAAMTGCRSNAPRRRERVP